MRYLNFASGQTDRGNGRTERLILAIDASPSMEETDWPPSRLEAAVEAAAALIQRKCRIAPEDQVGVVAYASRAWWVARPVAVDGSRKALGCALRGIRTASATNITAALQITQPVLLPGSPRSLLDRLLPPATASVEVTPRVVLLTDGAHNTGKDPRPVASTLKKGGVCIDCVGIGGEPSDVDEALLKAIASKHADGVTPRYTFIGDKGGLIEKFEELASRITR